MNHTHNPMDAVDQCAAAAVDLDDTLALIRVFVTVLLAEQAGPLTPTQQDLLRTIQARVARVLVEA